LASRRYGNHLRLHGLGTPPVRHSVPHPLVPLRGSPCLPLLETDRNLARHRPAMSHELPKLSHRRLVGSLHHSKGDVVKHIRSAVIRMYLAWRTLASPLPSQGGDQPWRADPPLKTVHHLCRKKILLVRDEWAHSLLITLSTLHMALLLSLDRRPLPALLAVPISLNGHCSTPR